MAAVTLHSSFFYIITRYDNDVEKIKNGNNKFSIKIFVPWMDIIIIKQSKQIMRPQLSTSTFEWTRLGKLSWIEWICDG